MKLHRNAKTTPAMRALIVQRIRQEHWPRPNAAAATGVSVSPRMLIVDEEALIRLALSDRLASAGYMVCGADKRCSE